MLIPRFSLRMLILITSLAAAVALLIGLAVKGYFWSGALVAGLASLAGALLAYAVSFLLVWRLATAMDRRPGGVPADESPQEVDR